VIGAVAALSLLAMAAVFYANGPAQKQTRQPTPTVPSAAVPSATAPLATVSSPTGSASLDSARTPEPGRSASGPGITSTGIHVVAAARADGTFDVAETAVFGRTRNRLRLAPPRSADGGAIFSTARPKAEMVQVTINGQPLSLKTGRVEELLDLVLPAPASKVELRYHLTGATVRSIPSVAGRGLAMLAPLTAPTDETLPTTLSIGGGPMVRNITCPRLPPARRLCGAGGGSRMQPPAGLVAGDAVFVVQLDLPKPS
jgi:hypothetical protein